ncbi:hypothetical protein AUJ15_02710 [Candidatus Micrarchaeota archaeon CG1_02_55_41]|nr:MAG: hypothetical protein AUJ15_02710 [Candidatus Micrarchaeota archaeon CG1_02_55_41]
MDIYPGVWKKMAGLIKSNRLVAPKEVFNEINQGDDLLFNWVKNQTKMFLEPTQKQIDIVKKILERYPSLIKVDRTYDADPWVIALAIELTENPQKTLVTIKRIVVTEEKERGNKINIPFVCNNYEIESIDILDMFRIEGWKF